jgi:hypothetical protein
MGLDLGTSFTGSLSDARCRFSDSRRGFVGWCSSRRSCHSLGVLVRPAESGDRSAADDGCIGKSSEADEQSDDEYDQNCGDYIHRATFLFTEMNILRASCSATKEFGDLSLGSGCNVLDAMLFDGNRLVFADCDHETLRGCAGAAGRVAVIGVAGWDDDHCCVAGVVLENWFEWSEFQDMLKGNVRVGSKHAADRFDSVRSGLVLGRGEAAPRHMLARSAFVDMSVTGDDPKWMSVSASVACCPLQRRFRFGAAVDCDDDWLVT